MSEVLHANIFFFIASVATVIFCLFVCLILYHVYKIAQSVRRIMERIEAGSELIADDVAFVRNSMKGGLMRIVGMLASVPKSRSRRSRKTSDGAETDEDD